MAIFWLFVYIFVNLTSVIYLGALAMKSIMGIDRTTGIIGLALFAGIYSIYGGLKAVAWIGDNIHGFNGTWCRWNYFRISAIARYSSRKILYDHSKR